ncbi:hypothetical protein GALL_339330 [mine drainage metagenome]|uniref:Heteromeric transposase endonuclease subunit TnsA n=1 Tax=mine drainage metagenome TaxID=410659 RepID=A0A1J5QLP2_9ZZZZ
MPVRKIPKNYLMVTGTFSSAKNGKSLGYESLLERDLMILLEFDDSVKSFEEQPVKVPLVANGKKLKPYVPDILIHYFPSPSGDIQISVLGEVKHSDDLKKNKAKYASKFDAASQYANKRGWDWRIFTEKEIVTPYLDNLKFLREYHSSEPEPSLIAQVIKHMGNIHGSIKVETLLHELCPSEDNVLQIAPVIWHLIATKRIAVNMTKPITMESKLSLPKETPP